MARISNDEAGQLFYVKQHERIKILYGYLVNGKVQKILAQDVYGDYGDWAAMRISLVTRAFGFHNGQGRGKYSGVPEWLISEFVSQYAPERYNGGLDEGTFDEFLCGYRRQMAEQKKREEEQRRQQAAEEERLRQQQIERERQRQEWVRQQEQLRKQQEAERRAREEAERQEQLRREREAQRKEAARQAAENRGDHETLMNEGFEALECKNYDLARSKAEQAWEIKPMIGLQYILACCADGQGKRQEAVKWAGDALEGYQESSKQYLTLCKIFLNNQGNPNAVTYGHKLYQAGQLEQLSDSGVEHLAKNLWGSWLRLAGGLRQKTLNVRDNEMKAFAQDMALLVWKRIPKDGAHRRLMLDSAHILTKRKCYSEALEIYNSYEENLNFGPAYDIRANKGMCYYGLGDKASARFIWVPDHMITGRLDTVPLEAIQYYGYDEAFLDVFHDNPVARQELALAQAFLNGDITGSDYYSRYFGNWHHALGLEPNEEIRWYCKENGQWDLDIFVPDPVSQIKEKAKGILGRLFGK